MPENKNNKKNKKKQTMENEGEDDRGARSNIQRFRS